MPEGGAHAELTGAKDSGSFSYRQWKKEVPIPVGTRYEDKNRHIASTEYRIEADGTAKSIMLTELEIRDYFDNLSGYFCTIQDITYQRSYEDSIIRSANTDMLTGMYNRRYFYSYLNDLAGMNYHLLYLGLDNFKAINDACGHSAGDEVLIRTAALIKEYFPDAVAARIGGDEFVIVDRTCSRAQIMEKCRRMQESFVAEFERFDCGANFSAGMVYNDGSIRDTDLLIRMSDERMYAEKKLHHET